MHSLLMVGKTQHWAHQLAFCLDEMQPIRGSHSAQDLSEATWIMKAVATTHQGQHFYHITSSLKFITHDSLLQT